MRLNIHFKNVGQGDTLFFDWTDPGNTRITKFGMIDCNLYNGGIEPVINHIEGNKIKEFEFVMMSHPHSDHFSGFMKFLDYCEGNHITIKKFIHTASFEPQYLSAILEKDVTTKKSFRNEITLTVNRGKHKYILWKLYKRLRQQHKSPDGFIKKVKILSADRILDITNEIKLKFLAPEGYDELDTYFDKMYSGDRIERIRFTSKYENNPYGNYLSSMLQLFSTKRNWQVLLCSDITKDTLTKLINDEEIFNDITSRQLLAAQIPHHGSAQNHVSSFWPQLNGIRNAHILISVGEGYGHPDSSVISFFATHCKKVHATNFVGGYKKHYAPLQFRESSKRAAALMKLPGISPAFHSAESRVKEKHPKCCEKKLSLKIDVSGHATCKVIDCPS